MLEYKQPVRHNRAGCIAINDVSEETAPQELPRAQLYGDPAIIQQISADGWRKTFGEGDAWLARHAIPGVRCDCKEDDATKLSTALLRIGTEDPFELARMKQMINWMKRELSNYLDAGGTEEDYKDLCDERILTEIGIVESYNHEFSILRKSGEPLEEPWEKKNATLRSMGLPTVPIPEND